MTCVIGYVKDGTAYMGADSSSIAGWNINATLLEKAFHRGPFMIGYAGSFRAGQILQYHLNVRLQEDGEDDTYFMVVVFAEAARELLKAKGFSKVENNKEQGEGFLVGYKGAMYLMDHDFQVNKFAGGLHAIGIGDEYAIGAMESFINHYQSIPTEPKEMIMNSLEIAGKYSAGVRGPYYVIEQEMVK